jgi:hypothetical protein
MALVNPNIAMSFRMPEFQSRNALAEYAQIQQIQGGQRQAEVADMQLESLRRDRDVLGRIQAAIVAKGGPPDLAAAADEMIKSGKPEYMTQGAAIRQKLADQAAFAAYQSEFEPNTQNALGASPTGMDLSAGAQAPGDYTSTQTMGRVPGVVTTPIPESPPMNAMAPAPAAPANAMASKPDVASLEARYRRVANIDTPGAKAEAALLLKQIERAAKTPEIPKLADRFVPVGKLVFDRETQQYISPSQAQLAQLQERPAAAAPVAPAPTPLTELQQRAQRRQMAVDKTSLKNSMNTVNELEKLADELVGNPEKNMRPHPGLRGISGFQAMVPSLPSGNARQAQQKLETVKGKVMAFGRQLASLEGKLGNMAVQEWKFVSDSIQALDPAAGNLDVQLRDIVRQAKNFAANVQERYDMTYEGDGMGEGAPPAAQSTMSPQDREALNWANSNPQDPRSAQIKQRLGVQ